MVIYFASIEFISLEAKFLSFWKLKIIAMKWEFPKDLSIHFNQDNGEYRVYRKTLLITKCHTLYIARTYVDAIIRALTIE